MSVTHHPVLDRVLTVRKGLPELTPNLTTYEAVLGGTQ